LKKVNNTTFYFVEEGQSRGSEDIKKECNDHCFHFFFFSVFLMDVMGGKKSQSTAKNCTKIEENMHTGKGLEVH